MILNLNLDLEIVAPWLTRNSGMGRFGVDVPLAMNPEGKYYIPGSLLIGRLSEAFAHLAEAEESYASALNTYFATASAGTDADSTGREPRRRIFASDLVLQDDIDAQAAQRQRTRIAIDNSAGRALDGALQVIEAPVKAGHPAHFSGTIRLVGTPDSCASLVPKLEKVLAWLTQVGGGRSFGFGVIGSWKLGALKALETQPSRPIAGLNRLAMRVTVHDPLCVGEKRTSLNSFQSSDVIPGGVLKGALARNLLDGAGLNGHLSEHDGFGLLGQHFSQLRISHAFPTKSSGSRPIRASHSAAFDGESFFDMAELADPDDTFAGWTFAPDWKMDVASRFREEQSWPDVPIDFRIRTAIDRKYRAAQEARLFGIEYRWPSKHEWMATVDVDHLENGPAILASFQQALANGLVGVGRGGAYCTFGFEVGAELETPVVADGDRLLLTLQTPALLRQPEPGNCGDVTQAYRLAFEELGLPGLRSLFVRESLHGGQFMARRLAGGSTYKPWLLTEAGSCFVFEVGANVPDLSRLVRFGLNVPGRTAEFYGIDQQNGWQTCPYLPENGYGEVRLHSLAANQLKTRPPVGSEPQ